MHCTINRKYLQYFERNPRNIVNICANIYASFYGKKRGLLPSIFRRFLRRSKKEETLLGGEGSQRKATYGACDHSDGVVDVEARGARGL